MGLGQYNGLGEYCDPHTASSVFLILIYTDPCGLSLLTFAVLSVGGEFHEVRTQTLGPDARKGSVRVLGEGEETQRVFTTTPVRQGARVGIWDQV